MIDIGKDKFGREMEVEMKDDGSMVLRAYEDSDAAGIVIERDDQNVAAAISTLESMAPNSWVAEG